jgi:hypothetical protein
MKKICLLFLSVLFSSSVIAQFDQKLSVDLAAGSFKTFGRKFTEYTGPLQMPNYKMGFSGSAGFQIRIGDHFSLAADFGIMITNRWNYRTPDKSNWLYWSIDDTITGARIQDGEDYMDLHNFSVSLRPKYYLLPGKKWNPYLFAGLNINWTQAYFENTEWEAKRQLGWPGINDPIPASDILEESFGIGFNPGAGLEYSPNDRLHFYFESGYYLILLEKGGFKDPSREENLNAVLLQLGCRFNFMKSKEL